MSDAATNKNKVRWNDLFPLRMDWSDELKDEIRGRYLSALKIGLICNIGVIAIGFLLIFYQRLFEKPVAIPIRPEYALLAMILIELSYLVVYVLLKKGVWIRALSLLLSVEVAFFLTFFAYIFGAPLSWI